MTITRRKLLVKYKHQKPYHQENYVAILCHRIETY